MRHIHSLQQNNGMGGVHWMLTDAIGSVEMVVDNRGSVEQHTGYYPYGEPWRTPAGQPYLFGAKERRSYASLNDYDFHARFHTPAIALWQAPDIHAGNRPWLSPFTFCSANPIRRIDPSGKDDKVLNQILGRQKFINLFDNDEEYKRSPERNPQPKNEQTQQSTESESTDTTEERSTLDKSAIAVNAASAPISKVGETIISVSEKATGLTNVGAVDTYYGKFGGNLVRFTKGVGVIGFALNTYIIGKTMYDYYQAGGNSAGVYTKLVTDEVFNAVGAGCGLPGLGVSVVYNIFDYATDGFGTDKKIKDQINKYK